jgi:hypothetical protein
MSNSCSIFFYEGYVGVAPTIINLCKALNEDEYLVTIYATNSPFPKPEKIDNKTEIIYFSKAFDIPIILKILLILKYKFQVRSIQPIFELVFFTLPCLIHLIKTNKFSIFKKSINIGVDTNGSISALIKSYIFRQKFIYLSLELNHPNRFIWVTKIINILERLAYRKSQCVIVQDEDRFNTLCEYNKYQHPKVFYLPNSPTSSTSLSKEVQLKNYFREIFNLSEEKFYCIILQAGMIQDAVFSKELAQAFVSINKGYALIFHDREQRQSDDPYIKSLKQINSKNLFLSLKPLPYEKIERIYTSATIGLAFYRNLDNNFSQISKASGKISHYLKYGVPLLVNNLESLSKLVEQYNVGIVIKDPLNSLEIESAIEKILKDYSYYSKNATICFEEQFNFSKKIQPILSFMKSL